MSLIPLKTTVKALDEHQRDLFVTYRVRTNLHDANDHVSLNIRHFDYGNGEEWLNWRKQLEYNRKLKGWQEAPELYQNVRILLRGAALVRFESVNSAVMGNEDVEHFDETLQRMTAMYFPKRPASKSRQYLRETAKPADMTVEDYVARLHQINELIQFLPPPNNRMTSHELREIVECNMPSAWQKKYDESGQDYESLEELVAYFRQLEEAEVSSRMQQHGRRNHKSSGSAPSNGGRGGQGGNRNRNSKKPNDAKKK